MVKCGVLFEVRTEFLNIIYTSFGFKGLRMYPVLVSVPNSTLVNVSAQESEKYVRECK
jgi:hypothetical protein